MKFWKVKQLLLVVVPLVLQSVNLRRNGHERCAYTRIHQRIRYNDQMLCSSTIPPTLDESFGPLVNEVDRSKLSFHVLFLRNLGMRKKGHVGGDCTQPLRIEVKQEDIFVLVFFDMDDVAKRRIL